VADTSNSVKTSDQFIAKVAPRNLADPTWKISGIAVTKPSRQPDASLLLRLNAEWNYLASSPASTATLQRWASHEPVLISFTDLHILRDVVHDRSDLDRSDKLLAALTRLGAIDGHNELLAARVLLQLLIPGAVRLAQHLTRIVGDRDTAQATVLSDLAILIRTFPWQRRRHRIAANLLLDTRQKILRCRQLRGGYETPIGLHPDPQEVTGTTTPDPTDTTFLARDLLTNACRTGVIDTFEARLLLANHVLDIPLSQLVSRLGRSRASLYAIRAAATERLRHALLEHEPH
jgi:hypothetical protein